MEVYDETLVFLDKLRMNPEIALTDDFYTESLIISNHLRAYGSKEVVKALRDAIMTLRKEKKECDSAIGELYERYMPCETIYDEEGKPIGEEPTPRIDMGEFEELLEMEKRKRVLPGRKMLELLSPAFESINKSIVTGRG